MIRIIGAGFSGLSLAYFFSKSGLDVEVVEKREKPGGIIHSYVQNEMLIETAANGFLSTRAIEVLFHDIGIVPLETKLESRKKYIFRNGMRRWPLSAIESIGFVFKLLMSLLTQSLKPKTSESLRSWADRVLGQKASDYLIQPMVNGIFAQKIELLSAPMVLGSMFYKKTRGNIRGLISAPNGMGEVILKLQEYLVRRGVRFLYKTDEKNELKCLQHNTFLAIDFFSFQHLVPPSSSFKYVTKTGALHSLSLMRVTLTYKDKISEIDGFGVLFPNVESFNSLGVLANTKIFSNRGRYNESWILSNATDEKLMEYSDEQIVQKILQDRKRLFSEPAEVSAFVVHRWPQTIPSYNMALEDFLLTNSQLTAKLTGNYLGVLGLAGIHERNSKLVADYLEQNKKKAQ